MKLLIEEYRKLIATLDKGIDIVYTKHEPFKESPRFRDQEETIKSHLDQLVKEILTTKELKFWRDKTEIDLLTLMS